MDKIDDEGLDAIEMVAEKMGIPDWDAIMVGDGAGADWTKPCGWAVTLIDRHCGGRKMFHGGMNAGTIGLAELFPYVHAMLWYANYRGKDVRRRNSPRPVEVHIITDSKGLADQGRRLAGNDKGVAEVRKNYPVWKMLFDFTRDGYRFGFHSIDRATMALNVLADHQADASKHAAANALAVALAKIRQHDPSDLEADDLIYLFNASSGIAKDGANDARSEASDDVRR